MNIRKRIFTLLLICSMGLLLTGCDLELVIDNFDNSASMIIQRNKDVVDNLYKAKIITAEKKQMLDTDLNTALETVRAYSNTNGDSINETLKSAISYMQNIEDGTGKPKIQNLYKSTKEGDLKDIEVNQVRTNVIPIEIFSSATSNSLNQMLNYNIYVLNPQQTPDNTSLNDLYRLTQKIVLNTATDSEKQVFTSYFKATGETYIKNENGVEIIKTTQLNTSSSNEKLGNDIVLTSDGVDTISIRVKEFNPEVIEQILAAGKGLVDKYYVENNNIYLLEYPVSSLTGISKKGYNQTITNEINSADEGVAYTEQSLENFDEIEEFECSIQNSNLIVNILKGTMLDAAGNEIATIGTENDTKNKSIYKVGNDEDNIDSSSFVFLGTTNITLDNGTTIGNVPKIVLRDYLELTYSPNVVNNDVFTALGRKIRFLNFDGKITDNIAVFVGKNGKVVNEMGNLTVQDFIDATIEDKDGTIYYKKIGNKNKEITNSTDDSNADNSGFTTGAQIYTTVDTYVNSIQPIMSFPSNELGANAVLSSVNSPYAYGIICVKSLFETSGNALWLNATETLETGSLTWWQNWLLKNNINYIIDNNRLSNFFNGSFPGILNKSDDTIILNLDTISKIQEDIDHENFMKLIRDFRTFCVILGVCIAVYGIFLVLAWWLDVMVAKGFCLLDKLTFNKMVAVMDTTGLEERDDLTFATFGRVSTYAAFLIVLGSCLIYVDMIVFIQMVFELFESLYEYIVNIFS